ncbi:MAG: 3-deoxy-7-phosphoheptulonate synthase [Chlamydiota bacterium]
MQKFPIKNKRIRIKISIRSDAKKLRKKHRSRYILKVMNYEISSLPSPNEIKTLLPLGKEESLFIMKARKQAIACLKRKDPRYVFFIGPCSIHEPNSLIEYCKLWKPLSLSLEKDFFLVLRFFTEKSRTQGGWKGFISDPLLDGSNNLHQGIIETRKLLLTLTQNGIPCASEIVDPLLTPYFDDLLTWGFIGARSASSQVHRQHASKYDFPIGWKNSVDGNVDVAIQGAINASQKHVFPSINQDGKISLFSSHGNPHTHIVLRGSTTHENYDLPSIHKVLQKLYGYSFSRPLLIDCSHGNAQKDLKKQKKCFEEVLTYMTQMPIFGMMLESFIYEGNQSLHQKPLTYGISVTDPCLSFETTAHLLLLAQKLLSSKEVCGRSMSTSFVQK